MKKYKYFL